MEDKLIFKPSHLKSKVLSTLTVCGGALFLLSGNAAADDQTTDVQQPVTPQQTTNEQPIIMLFQRRTIIKKYNIKKQLNHKIPTIMVI